MKKILLVLVSFISSITLVHASSVNSVNMDVYVDNYGDATITETWDANPTEGTELYHPYFNIGNSSIQLLSASMDNTEYTIDSYWDVNKSLSDKSKKAGIYTTGNEVDICLGITSYGHHTYKFVYKITNFILKTSDADIAYWTLFPYDFKPSHTQVYIKVHSDFEYEDSLDVWGYGNYGGTAYVYDGYIEMQSPESGFDSSQYMTILIKYPKDTFETDNVSDKDFNYYYDMAEDGTTHYSEKKQSMFSKILNFLVSLFWIGFVIAIIKIILKASKGNYDFGETGNKVRKDVPNFRDIPCNKDIFRAYFVSSKYNLNKAKEDFLGAILLKWLRNGNVTIEKVTKNGLFKDKTEDNIVFVKKPENIMNSESNIYDWMLEASKDGKLESKEFEKWCKNHYEKILKWFDEVLNEERDLLIQEGKIQKQEKGKVFKSNIYVVDPSMMIEAEQMAGLKKFLKEFSRIQTREPIEVQLWDEYLMYAQIFGIAKEVANQFKNLYPEIGEYMENTGYNFDNIVFLSNISTSGIHSASVARSRAQSYSSGGGGFSSGGGGGGSFGGGGGGGGFR